MWNIYDNITLSDGSITIKFPNINKSFTLTEDKCDTILLDSMPVFGYTLSISKAMREIFIIYYLLEYGNESHDTLICNLLRHVDTKYLCMDVGMRSILTTAAIFYNYTVLTAIIRRMRKYANDQLVTWLDNVYPKIAHSVHISPFVTNMFES